MAAELKVSYATLEQKVKDKTRELEQTNVELEQANQNLIEANKGKDEFLSVMSHELRTPLNVIMGYTGMVKEGILGSVNHEQDRALEKAIARSGDLLIMINQILQATSIEAGKVQVEKQAVHLKSFLESLRSNYEVPLNNDISINWDCPLDALTVETDSAKLKHILQNLINNAIKFTAQGSVNIAAKHIPEAQAVEFQVADTGIGISKEMLPSVFEIFHQVDSSETRTYGGVGIGLYIVKKYTELLGGTIEVESALGKGTTFTLTIPADQPVQ
jgi:signal transduction histidine kinase